MGWMGGWTDDRQMDWWMDRIDRWMDGQIDRQKGKRKKEKERGGLNDSRGRQAPTSLC